MHLLVLILMLQWNVDVNRVLAVVPDPTALIGAASTLSRLTGGLAKFKNGFGLSKADAEEVFHLRLILASVIFEMPKDEGERAWAKDHSGTTGLRDDEVLTYGGLAQSKQVRAVWDGYATQQPVGGEVGAQWDADVTAARAFLEDASIADTPVRIITEVQLVLRLMLPDVWTNLQRPTLKY